MRISRPTKPDVALAVICAAALLVDEVIASHRPGLLAAVPLALFTCGPLAWRSRAPALVLPLVWTGLIVWLEVGLPSVAATGIAMVTLFSVGLLGDRRRSVLVGVISGIVLIALIWELQSDEKFTEGMLRLLMILSALVGGDAIRTRRELRHAASDRALRERREQEADARRRLDEERIRIAREVHDTIAHALVAINVRSSVAAHLQDREQEAAALLEIKQVSADALGDLRSTLDVLREGEAGAPTKPAQSLEDLPELLERARAGGLDAVANVEVNGTPVATPVGQAGFRIVQESLTNVLRHADATRACVRVRVIVDRLDIEVVDDGRAMAVAVSVSAGHGLRGMAERATALGGRMDAGPAAGGGWRVHAELPLAGNA